MYKKIKNSSFMNLFWFIICLLPLIFLLIYSSQYIFNKKDTKEIKNYFNKDTLVVNTHINYNELTNTFYTNDTETIAIQFDIKIEDINVNNLYIYMYNDADKPFLWSYSLLKEDKTFITNTQIRNLDYNENFLIIDFYNFIKENEQNNQYYETPYYLRFGLGIRNAIEPHTNNVRVGLFLEDITNYNLLDDNNFNYLNINNMSLYLNDLYNTFASNGFINNSLLLVINYFNVNNVYMQLAILYIEYFIIIQLLHLFVDFVLLVPNICHKFMEKIGGERD